MKIKHNEHGEGKEQIREHFGVSRIFFFAIKPYRSKRNFGLMIVICLYVPYFYILCYITAFACIIKIIASDDHPDDKVPWVLFVLVVPIAGFMLYFMFYSRKL